MQSFVRLVVLGLVLSLSVARSARADEGHIAVIEDTNGEITAGVAMPNIYLSKAACAFYQDHGDNYDALFVFTTIPLMFLTNVQAGWPVKSTIQGIGRDMPYDSSKEFCSARLRQAVKMGDLAQLPANPDDPYTGIPFYALSGIELMGHEFGHQWLASVTFDTGDGNKHCLIRGFEPNGSAGKKGDCDGYEEYEFNQHWSYYFNSGSLMYGSMINDLGNGSFELYYKDPKYSPLDQYLMGIRPKEDVPPMFLVDVDDFSGSASLPIAGAPRTESGTRLDFTIDDIIRAEGPRVPATDNCHWTAAFVVIHAADTPPDAAQIAKVETYRQRWEEFYHWATDKRGSFDTTLDNSGPKLCAQFKPDAGPDATVSDASIEPDLGGPDGGVDAEADVSEQPDSLSSDAAADTPPPADDGGCSCETAARTDSSLPPVVLLLFVVGGRLLRRRRRRQRERR